MVVSCAALGCKVRYVKGINLSFHSFPADPVRRLVWTVALKRENFKATNYTKICSKHFSPECFDTEAFGFGRRLKRDAVPSIFDFPPHVALKGRKKLPQFERNKQEVSSTWESEMYSINNLPPKRRRTSKKSCICDCQKGAVNFVKCTKNSLKNNKKRRCLHRKKFLCAIKKTNTAQPIESGVKQDQMTFETITEMLQVELYPHVFAVNVKQEPGDSVNVELAEGRLAATNCSVVIKEEPELQLGVDIIDNGLAEGGLVATECSVVIKEEPELQLGVNAHVNYVDTFAEYSVPESSLPSIKQEVV